MPSAPLVVREDSDLKKYDGSGRFRETSIAFWSRTLRISYSVLYDVCTKLGLNAITNDEDLWRVVQSLQTSAVPFSILCRLYGGGTRIQKLSENEVLP